MPDVPAGLSLKLGSSVLSAARVSAAPPAAFPLTVFPVDAAVRRDPEVTMDSFTPSTDAVANSIVWSALLALVPLLLFFFQIGRAHV